MPQQLTYPGVYVEEAPSGVRTIVGVATSIALFVGRTRKGPTDRAVTISNYGQFVDELGGLWPASKLGFAVRDFYANGGRQALICRLYAVAPGSDGRARFAMGADQTKIALLAASPGAWGNALRGRVDHAGLPAEGELFNLVVSEEGGNSERFAGLSLYADRPRNLRDVLATESTLVRWDKDAMQLLDAPAPGEDRVGPDDGASDPVSEKEDTLDGAKKDAAAKARTAATATAASDKAAAAAKTADDETTAAQTAKADADQAVQLATDAEQQAKTELDQANDAVTAAAAEDQTVPANQQALKDAQEDQAKKQKAHDDAQAALDSAKAKATEAATALQDATQNATKAQADATTASTEADQATQAKTAADTAAADAQKAVDQAAALGGDDGGDVDLATDDAQGAAQGLLDRVDLFNLMCIPPYKAAGDDVEPAVYDWAAAYCIKRRAVLLVDPPSSWTAASGAVEGFRNQVDQLGGRSTNSAVYFPRLRQPNPLDDNTVETFAPCGAVAGVMARTDGARGVWKAPAGLDAGLVGVPDLAVRLSDDENGLLNPLGVNCLRSFPIVGRAVWGARTLVGADALASEWKYVPIRRLALFIEESLFRGTKWVVFEPNDEPLWAQIRLSVGSFMHELFRQGALQGRSPREAYFVKCDAETTTQADRNLGVVNIVVGFAPLKPAEFVVIRLQQMAGQIEV